MNTTTEYPPTPELDRMKAVKGESQTIGAFLEWLQGRGYYICTFNEKHEVYDPDHRSIEKTLADYYGISLTKIENERRAILKHLRTEPQPGAASRK